jgi:MtrB/PioB family decaheme-associated outer membrane protein
MTRTIGGSATTLLAACTFLALAPVAQAEDEDEQKYHDLVTLESTLELGALFDSTDDYKFGDYTGLTQQGYSVLGNADLRRRSAYDAELPYYIRVRGLNLGLESRRVDALFKMPGRFGLSFLFDEIPKYQTDSAFSPYLNTGSSVLTLPPGWDPGSNPSPAQMTTLQASLRELNLAHQRRTLGGGGSLVLSKNLDFDASYRRQTKKGEKLTAGMFGRTGGNPRSIIIPEPIDYIFHQIDSHLRYSTDQVQVQLQYYGSGFENDDRFLRWQDPFTAVGGGNGYDPAAAYPAFGQKGTMPDNWFHQGVVSAGVNLPMNSRLMLNTAFGFGRQDEDFLPYALPPSAGGPNFTGSPAVNYQTPRNDLDGKIRTGMASIRFVSNPLPKLGIALAYRWDERDNKTPVDSFSRVLNDSGAAGANLDQNPADSRINRPYGWDKQHVDADLSYRILPRTKLTLSYDWEQMERSYQELNRSNEHTYGVKLVTRPHSRISGGLRFERAYRDNDNYNCVRPWVETEPSELFGTDVPGCQLQADGTQLGNIVFENHPDARKFNQAERRRNNAHLWASFALLDNLSLGIDGRYTHDDYFDSELGLTARRAFSPGVDLSWSVTEWLSFHTFYQYDETRSKQDSIDNDGDDYPIARGWSGRDRDVTHTAGAGIDVVAIPDRLSFGVEYLFARSRSVIDIDVNDPALIGASLPLLPFPDDVTDLHDLSVRSELQLTRNVSLRLGYLYERYKSRDWAIDGVCAACLNFSGNASVIASGEKAPDYDVHVGSVSVILHFW